MSDGYSIMRSTPDAKGTPRRQSRSIETKSKISAAAVDLLSYQGIAGLTHRQVAERANVPLAATTYHFATKRDIVASASNAILDHLKTLLSDAVENCKQTTRRPAPTKQLLVEIVQQVAAAGSAGLALFEILLESVRRPEDTRLGEQWIDQVTRAFLNSSLEGATSRARSAHTATDILMGLLLLTSSLRLTPDQVGAVLLRGGDPLQLWAVEIPAGENAEQTSSGQDAGTNKTRQRILEEAINILVADGASGLSYKVIADRVGLSAAAPSYHFASVIDLLRSAQLLLFEASQLRYHSLVTATNFKTIDQVQFIDLTSVVFQREVTEFGRFNLATFSIWLEAGRRPELRPLVWRAVVRHCQSSARLLNNYTSDFRIMDGLLYHTMFFGKLVRILSTGTSNLDLMHVRAEFASEIEAAIAGRHWLV